MNISKASAKAVDALLGGHRKATVYLSEKLTVTATRRRFRGKVQSGPRFDISLTIAKPNFGARAFIKQLKRAGEPFPVRKVQVK